LGKPKKLLDQMCDVMRLKHYSLHTEEAYLGWIKRFILFPWRLRADHSTPFDLFHSFPARHFNCD
jgi:hypothetical protein